MTASASPQVIQRSLRNGRIRETIGFFGAGPHRMFGVTHLPAAPPVVGLVICSSIGPEQLTGYRNEVRLARNGTAAGVAVQRFHYRGTGHSDGEGAAVTVPSMVADALEAAAYLRETAGVARIAFLGTRWGALPAVAAAAGAAGTPVVLWEPVADPRRAFRELFRTQASHELKIGRPRRRAGDLLAAELESLGRVDILGYWLHRVFVDSAMGATLGADLAGPRRILLVRLGRTVGADAGLGAFRAQVEAAGCTVEEITLPQAPVWHFVDHAGDWGDALVRHTGAWLAEALGARSGQGTGVDA